MPDVGTNVTYSVQVINNGPSDATGVALTDSLPAGLSLVSASASQGSYSSATGVWSVSGQASGASASLTIVATVTQSGAISNSATVTAADQPDPSSANNTDAVGITGQAADLAVSKTVDVAMPNVGTNVTYSDPLSLHDALPISGVALTDSLPAGLSLVSASASQGSYSSATGV